MGSCWQRTRSPAGYRRRARAAQAKPDRLKTVLAQMDAGSKTFRSAEASIQKQQFEKIVNDTIDRVGDDLLPAQLATPSRLGRSSIRPTRRRMEYKNGP